MLNKQRFGNIFGVGRRIDSARPCLEHLAVWLRIPRRIRHIEAEHLWYRHLFLWVACDRGCAVMFGQNGLRMVRMDGASLENTAIEEGCGAVAVTVAIRWLALGRGGEEEWPVAAGPLPEGLGELRWILKVASVQRRE